MATEYHYVNPDKCFKFNWNVSANLRRRPSARSARYYEYDSGCQQGG